MDRASERERDSRRTREERDRGRERDGKKLRRHEDGEERRLEHHRHRYGDSSPPESHRRRHDRSPDRHRDSVERRHRSRGDSPSDLESRDRDSVEHDRDKDRRLQRASREDLGDGGPRKRDSSDRVRKSVERERFSREDSSERRHSSRKRKDHRSGDDDELESNHSKRARIPDVVEERKLKGRVEDRVVEDDSVLSEVNKEERRGRILKDRRKEEMIDMEEDKKHRLKKEEDINVNGNKERRRNGRRSGYDAELGDKLDAEDGKVTVRKERRFEDANEEKMLDSSVVAKPIFSSKHSEGESKMKQLDSGDRGDVLPLTGGSSANAFSGESLAVGSKVSKTCANSNSLHTKVSSITATNENEGVSIIRSDEVTGKSSTDGTSSSVAGKSGSLSRDALAKAKKALQMQKELSEKLKKISVLNKQSSASFKDNLHRESSDYTGATSRHGDSISLSSSISTPMQMMPNAAKLDVPIVPSENASAASGNSILPGLANAASYEAVKRAQELAARMGFRQDPDFAPLINMFPGTSATDTGAQQLKSTKVPVLLLDAQGREIDQHGNVICQPKVTNLSTLKVNINKQKKEAFHILRPELDADAELSQHFDPRMGINKMKLMRPKRAAFQFVEEGRWSKQAEVMKIKNQFGEAQAKELKVKQSQLAKAKAEPDDNPNLIAVGERTFKEKKKDEVPEIEWWDKSFLPSGSYNDFAEDNLNLEKITVYVEHPRPIEPPVEPAPPPPQPLKLTKKEQKKLRTQRRLAKERDRQEMISQGLLEPPKPKVKMSNLMKVLSSEATQDPTKVEKEVRAAALEREQAHIDRNIARKLTPQERREKKERKLFEDCFTLESLVSVYRINDLSHPQTRFKVDVNAQENRLTGCAIISDSISVVVVEGGRKSIKRYGKLMLKRINWTAAVGGNEDGVESSEAPLNRCVLVWQGSIAKPSFNRFHVHQCRSEAASRKILADAGVPHYWDLAVNFLDDLS